MQKKILVWYFRQKGESSAVYKRLRVLEAMGFVPSYINIARNYASLPVPADMFNGFDALLILGASELFFDGGKHSDAEERTRAHDILAAVRPHIAYVLQKDMPTFAFCFGHQLIAAVMGSVVVRHPEHGKTGTHAVHLTEEGRRDPLLANIPDTFMAQYAHKDVVTQVPPDAVLLAEGARCHSAMLRYGKHVYTSQFHPELDKSLFLELMEKIKKYIDKSRPEIGDTPHATEILKNFGRKVLNV